MVQGRCKPCRRGTPPVSAREFFSSRARTPAAVAAIILFWGANFSVVKFALSDLAPLAFTTLRFVLASAILWGVLVVAGESVRIERRHWGRVIGLALVGTTGYQTLFISGIDRTLAGNASLILATGPVFTTLLAVAFRQERSTRRAVAGVGLSVAGAGLVVLGGARGVGLSAGTLPGDLLVLAAAVGWAIYTVGSAPLVRRYGAIPLTATTMWIGTAGLLVVSAPAIRAQAWTAVHPATWLAVVYSGAFSIATAYLLWAYCLRQIGSTRTVVYTNATPLVALALAWATLGEMPSPLQVVGAVGIVAGSLVVTLHPRSN
jgi:drug/metabolite transporter (DMT)-like permease